MVRLGELYNILHNLNKDFILAHNELESISSNLSKYKEFKDLLYVIFESMDLDDYNYDCTKEEAHFRELDLEYFSKLNSVFCTDGIIFKKYNNTYDVIDKIYLPSMERFMFTNAKLPMGKDWFILGKNDLWDVDLKYITENLKEIGERKFYFEELVEELGQGNLLVKLHSRFPWLQSDNDIIEFINGNHSNELLQNIYSKCYGQYNYNTFCRLLTSSPFSK
jgi:hypothetical protein